MAVIGWLKNRVTKSRYVSDQAVSDFTRVARDQSLPLDYGNDQRLAELLASNDDPAGNMAEIAKLLGQSKP